MKELGIIEDFMRPFKVDLKRS